MDLAPDFRDLLEELARGRVELVLVGGYAVAFHGRPRATKDIDRVRSLAPTEVAFMGQPPLRVDFLRTIDGVTPEALFAHAINTELDGVALKVISLDDLIANKRAAGRPQDLIDAEFLERVRRRA
jgi:predicted nucleotidyltransferase